jgi:phage shock protein A
MSTTELNARAVERISELELLATRLRQAHQNASDIAAGAILECSELKAKLDNSYKVIEQLQEKLGDEEPKEGMQCSWCGLWSGVDGRDYLG